MSGGMEMPVVTTATAGALRMLREIAGRSPLVTEALAYKLAELRVKTEALAIETRKAHLDAMTRDAEDTTTAALALIAILQEAKK